MFKYGNVAGVQRRQLRAQAIAKAKEEISRQGFKVSGLQVSIHSAESQRFMRTILQGAGWVQQIMQHGLYPAFTKEPARYREGNNQSALRQMTVVRKKVEEWLQQGAVMHLAEPAWCTSPLSVATKWDTASGAAKHRVVLDLSRHVNLHVERFTVQMDDLMSTQGLRQEGDHLMVFDLENQFFHMQLHPEAYKFFGFAVPEEDGSGERFYCFKVMVYGYAPAVAVVTKLVRPVLAYAHLQGLRASMFVDDGQVSGETKEETEEATRLLWDLFKMAGWNIQWKKTTKSAEQKVRYLGVEVDCKDMVYRLPEDKLADIEAGLDRELAKGRSGRQTEVREAAEVLGKLAACKLTHGRTILMLTRKAQQQLGEVTQQGGWDVQMKWTPEAVQELNDVRKHLRFLNGKNIRREDGPETCYTKEDTERYKNKVAQYRQGCSKMEDFKQCSYVVTAKTEVIQVVDGVEGQMDKGRKVSEK